LPRSPSRRHFASSRCDCIFGFWQLLTLGIGILEKISIEQNDRPQQGKKTAAFFLAPHSALHYLNRPSFSRSANFCDATKSEIRRTGW